MQFLLECLEDLDVQFKEEGGRLNMVLGKPLDVFAILINHFDIVRVCFDQDSEACWLERDNGLKNFCMKYRIQVTTREFLLMYKVPINFFFRWLRTQGRHCGTLLRSLKPTEVSPLSPTPSSVTFQKPLDLQTSLIRTLTSPRWI